MILRAVGNLLSVDSHSAKAVHASDASCFRVDGLCHWYLFPAEFHFAIHQVLAPLVAAQHEVMRHIVSERVS